VPQAEGRCVYESHSARRSPDGTSFSKTRSGVPESGIIWHCLWPVQVEHLYVSAVTRCPAGVSLPGNANYCREPGSGVNAPVRRFQV
jgi:hypothetical protein